MRTEPLAMCECAQIKVVRLREKGKNMLTYNLSAAAAESLYEQLYRCIKADIEAGVLKADSRLPSKRSFAKNLGLSNTTVENAYAQLVTEGYLYALPKRGFFVSALDRAVLAQQGERTALHSTPQAREEDAVDLLFNGVSTALFPFATWLRLMRQVMSTENEERLLTDRPAAGLFQLRNAIAAHLRDFRGMQVQPEQIIVGAGTEYLYTVLIQLLGRHCVYGVEDPGYLRLSRIYACNDVRCAHLPLDEAGVMPEAINQAQVDILHITPSHHYPTGIVMPVTRRYALLSWAAQQEGRYLIEDDYDCEFRLAGRPIPSLQSIDTMEKVIYINTFSQSLAPAFRMSYLVLPPHLVRRFTEKMGFYSGTVSCFEQLTLARFIEGGYFEKHINRMRTHYRGLRDLFLQALRESPLAARARIIEEDAGVHFLLELDTQEADASLVARAAAQGLRLSCLSDYVHHPSRSRAHVLVINYAGIKPAKTGEVVARLCACVFPDEGKPG